MNLLDSVHGNLALARQWHDDAETIRRYDPEDPKARVLEECAAQLREQAEHLQPEWVSLSSLVAWSGWSRSALARRCRNHWEDDGLARQDEKGRWFVAWSAATTVPRKTRPVDGIEGMDYDELTTRLALEE